MEQEKRLTVIGHLQELRKRLLWSVIAIGVGIIASFPLVPHIFNILESRAEGVNLIAIHITEMIGIYLKVVLYCGIALALPYLIYQLVMFLSPALRNKEKKYVYFSLPLIFVLFAAGVCFAYFVFLPPALTFLINFGQYFGVDSSNILVSDYISVVARLLFAVGLVFEIPLVITLLAKIGIVSSQKLAKGRKWAILAAFIIAAIITPTVDPVNQALIAAPIIVLYELSIWLAKLVYPRETLVPSTNAATDD